MSYLSPRAPKNSGKDGFGMINQCEIVQDVLPLYVDSACSASSTAMIEEHLDNCPKCKSLYEKLCSDSGEEILKAEMVGVVAKHEKQIKKKRILSIVISVLVTFVVLMLAVALLFTSYPDLLFTTSEYRTYQSFANNHRAGMEKQEILDKLGCPDGYVDAQGNYQAIKRADQESFKDNLSADTSTTWVYECWKRPDPADPYRLKITFDADGKSKGVELAIVPGG